MSISFSALPPSVASSQIAHTLEPPPALCFSPSQKSRNNYGAVPSGLVRTSARSVGDMSVETVLKYIE
jgi:hypothetical protein